MHWPSKKPAPLDEVAQAASPGVASTGFSAPPPSDVQSAPSRFSAPPTAPTIPVSAAAPTYDSMDFSKYSVSTYESDGLQDAQLAKREQSVLDGQWITNPRARQCYHNIQLGAKMGASVGGCFGLLTGCWVAVTQRNPLVLPVSVIGGAISFGFFLGCGMIIRCEEKDAHVSKAIQQDVPPVAIRKRTILHLPRTADLSPMMRSIHNIE